MSFGKDQRKMICDYCGKEQEKIMFMIGAAKTMGENWIMHEGTGKISCPEHNEQGTAEGIKAIDRHVEQHNKRVSNETGN